MKTTTLAALCLSSAGFLLTATDTEAANDSDRRLTLSASIESRLTEGSAPLDSDSTIEKAVRRFYRQRDYAPAWSSRTGLRRGRELVTLLHAAKEHALRPTEYGVDELEQRLARTDTQTDIDRAELDIRLTHAFVRYADHLYGGRIDPQAINADWYTAAKGKDYARLLTAALEGGDLGGALDRLAPRQAAYSRLKRALADYRKLADQGGWTQVPDGETLEVGDRSERVAALRERLVSTGDLAAPPFSFEVGDLYSDTLEQAVERFQRRHGLKVDGKVGPNTLEALNVPVEERIREIEINLERWRWLPQELGERYLLVNIPTFELYAFNRGEADEQMKVVVGADWGGRETPIFGDQMEYVIFRPYWNIPYSIAVNEILPQARENLSFLSEKGYEIVDHYGPQGEPHALTEANLDLIVEGELFLRQKSGPSNALGLVKFMFPNDHAVYLHDTPADHLFAKPERDFSHGCIRVARPPDLAAWVLAQQEEWTRERIDAALHEGEWQRVDLERPIPVYVLYWTAFVTPEGVLQLREDIYGHDDELLAAF